MEDNDKKPDSVEPKSQPAEGVPTQEAEFVARKAYEEVSSDMHKYKQRYKEAQAAKNEYATKLKSIEEETLKDQERWKELYEQGKAEKEQLMADRDKEKQLYSKSVKLAALKAQLGGKIKDEYLSLANVSGIQLNEDGTLSSDSVHEVANAFRQEHPMLIPQEASGNVTGQAPTNSAIKTKTLDDMSIDEKVELLTQMSPNRRK